MTAGGPLVIDGGDVITTSGGGTTRVWMVETSSVLTLQHMTVIDGFVNENNGGGIHNKASLTLINCTLSRNVANSPGGAIANGGTLTVINSTMSKNVAGSGGAISNIHIATITNSTFSGNHASFDGGAISNDGTVMVINSTMTENSAGYGGAIYTQLVGKFTITNSTLSDNNASWGCGALYNRGTLTITNSTLSGNTATWGGGALCNDDGTLTITNSTFSGNNTSESGGAILNGGFGILTLSNSTVSSNIASYYGGGIYNENTLMATNTIIANNASGGDCYNYSGTITDGGHNLDSDGTCGLDPGKGSLPNTDPLLGPLQDNGGPTWTHALLPGSPAIDAGGNAQCPSTDQRGVPRPQGPRCDMGAVEYKISSISGNAGSDRVILSYFDGTYKTAYSNGSGNYTFTVSDHWTGVVTPFRCGYNFTPTNRSYAKIIEDQSGQNYTATPYTSCWVISLPLVNR